MNGAGRFKNEAQQIFNALVRDAPTAVRARAKSLLAAAKKGLKKLPSGMVEHFGGFEATDTDEKLARVLESTLERLPALQREQKRLEQRYDEQKNLPTPRGHQKYVLNDKIRDAREKSEAATKEVKEYLTFVEYAQKALASRAAKKEILTEFEASLRELLGADEADEADEADGADGADGAIVTENPLFGRGRFKDDARSRLRRLMDQAIREKGAAVTPLMRARANTLLNVAIKKLKKIPSGQVKKYGRNPLTDTDEKLPAAAAEARKNQEYWAEQYRSGLTEEQRRRVGPAPPWASSYTHFGIANETNDAWWNALAHHASAEQIDRAIANRKRKTAVLDEFEANLSSLFDLMPEGMEVREPWSYEPEAAHGFFERTFVNPVKRAMGVAIPGEAEEAEAAGAQLWVDNPLASRQIIDRGSDRVSYFGER